MKTTIKKTLKPLIPKSILERHRQDVLDKQIGHWVRAGCPAPPPHIIKQLAIAEYQEKYGHHILIETGTYLGDMIEAQKMRFSKILSIELGADLYQKAKKRFSHDPHVTIVHGDSTEMLPLILKQMREPAIFWLDGHYSAGITAKGEKECPIYEELEAILAQNHLEHVILIDDARCFVGKNDYPWLKDLQNYITHVNPRYQIEVKHDIIRCTI